MCNYVGIIIIIRIFEAILEAKFKVHHKQCCQPFHYTSVSNLADWKILYTGIHQCLDTMYLPLQIMHQIVWLHQVYRGFLGLLPLERYRLHFHFHLCLLQPFKSSLGNLTQNLLWWYVINRLPQYLVWVSFLSSWTQ